MKTLVIKTMMPSVMMMMVNVVMTCVVSCGAEKTGPDITRQIQMTNLVGNEVDRASNLPVKAREVKIKAREEESNEQKVIYAKLHTTKDARITEDLEDQKEISKENANRVRRETKPKTSANQAKNKEAQTKINEPQNKNTEVQTKNNEPQNTTTEAPKNKSGRRNDKLRKFRQGDYYDYGDSETGAQEGEGGDGEYNTYEEGEGGGGGEEYGEQGGGEGGEGEYGEEYEGGDGGGEGEEYGEQGGGGEGEGETGEEYEGGEGGGGEEYGEQGGGGEGEGVTGEEYEEGGDRQGTPTTTLPPDTTTILTTTIQPDTTTTQPTTGPPDSTTQPPTTTTTQASTTPTQPPTTTEPFITTFIPDPTNTTTTSTTTSTTTTTTTTTTSTTPRTTPFTTPRTTTLGSYFIGDKWIWRGTTRGPVLPPIITPLPPSTPTGNGFGVFDNGQLGNGFGQFDNGFGQSNGFGQFNKALGETSNNGFNQFRSNTNKSSTSSNKNKLGWLNTVTMKPRLLVTQAQGDSQKDTTSSNTNKTNRHKAVGTNRLKNMKPSLMTPTWTTIGIANLKYQDMNQGGFKASNSFPNSYNTRGNSEQGYSEGINRPFNSNNVYSPHNTNNAYNPPAWGSSTSSGTSTNHRKRDSKYQALFPIPFGASYSGSHRVTSGPHHYTPKAWSWG